MRQPSFHRAGSKLSRMDELFGFTSALWRFGDALTQVLMVGAAGLAGLGLVFSAHARTVAAATLVGLLALRMLG
jgi:hypothetical protein